MLLFKGDNFMSITQLKSGSFRAEVYCPKEFRKEFGLTGERFRGTRITEKEAKDLEELFNSYIKFAKSGHIIPIEKKNKQESQSNDFLFKDFYKHYWLSEYKNGRTAKCSNRVPTRATVLQTENIFKCQILPIFGDYTISYLNENKQLVVRKLNEIAEEYANIKTVKSYFNQIFDLAEFEEVIEVNKIEKALRRVTDVKKQKIKAQKNFKEEALSVDELNEWIQAFESELINGSLIFMDYLLFHLTLKTGIRKSEAYAFQWKHVDFKNNFLYLVQSLDKEGNIKNTKGNKKSKIPLPSELSDLLLKWKNSQLIELKNMGITFNDEQFIFTYTNDDGKVNSKVHIDYLNYRLNTMKRKYPNLAKLNPHKLRHTFATLACEGGANIDTIQKALTHSDTATTSVYINTNMYKVDPTAYESFEKRMKETE
ncbi:hypothetical protein CBF28_12920 [Vagococcus carniphilus]|uniref:Tyr recombinase domain-containing protein n=2 Tax=Vagococcus carniphilus TaxID=218144 RepID=A0A430ARW6_9ENTE|nr:hypothetical protein CBF28_12920 [Vagococcus carniphilus]